MRLGVLISHPIQYYTPIFRELALRLDLHVFFGQTVSPKQHASSGFGVQFEWDIDLLSGYPHTFLHNTAEDPGVDFWGCDTPEIGQRLRDGNFDVFLVVGWYLKCFVQGIWAAKRLGLPVLVRGDSHLATPRSQLKRLGKAVLYPRILRLFNAALYVGQSSRKYYEYYGYPAERLFLSPHCVDTKWFAAMAVASGRERLRAEHGILPCSKVLLFAGKLLPFKRPGDLIAAAANLRANGLKVEVMVAGDGELRSVLERQARDLHVPLHLLGFRNQTEMPAVYASSDILVLPSSGEETWGLVANEAQACGRPIVVSDACGCAADLAADGVAGRSFIMGDITALAAAIASIINNPPTDEAIAYKSGQHTIDAAVSGIERAARQCVATRKP